MRLIKLKDGSYVNPEQISLITVFTGHTHSSVIIRFVGGEKKNEHQLVFSGLAEAKEYLKELIDLCQETSEIMNRLDQLETDIRYLPGGPEYQKAAKNFHHLSNDL